MTEIAPTSVHWTLSPGVATEPRRFDLVAWDGEIVLYARAAAATHLLSAEASAALVSFLPPALAIRLGFAVLAGAVSPAKPETLDALVRLGLLERASGP